MQFIQSTFKVDECCTHLKPSPIVNFAMSGNHLVQLRAKFRNRNTGPDSHRDTCRTMMSTIKNAQFTLTNKSKMYRVARRPFSNFLCSWAATKTSRTAVRHLWWLLSCHRTKLPNIYLYISCIFSFSLGGRFITEVTHARYNCAPFALLRYFVSLLLFAFVRFISVVYAAMSSSGDRAICFQIPRPFFLFN